MGNIMFSYYFYKMYHKYKYIYIYKDILLLPGTTLYKYIKIYYKNKIYLYNTEKIYRYFFNVILNNKTYNYLKFSIKLIYKYQCKKLYENYKQSTQIL